MEQDWNIPKVPPIFKRPMKEVDGVKKAEFTDEYAAWISDREIVQKDGHAYVTDTWMRSHAYTQGYEAGWKGYSMNEDVYLEVDVNRQAYEQGYMDGKADRKFALLD